MENGKNNWDHANKQGENLDISNDQNLSIYKQDDPESNTNNNSDGYGIESARSENTRSASQMGSRSGNSESGSSGSRNYDSGGGNSGSAGRAS